MLIGRDIACALDPTLFAEAAAIVCDPWQAGLLRVMPRRGLLLCSRQSGKTTVTAVMALHVAKYTPDALIVVVSPSQRQSAEMLRTIRLLHAKIEGEAPLGAESILKIEMANGSRIIALPGSERTVRGLAGVKLAVVDEAAGVEDDLLAAIRPMLATSNGSLIALSTPKGKRGWFYDAWHGDEDWHRVRVPASDCPRISKEFLDEERRALGAMRFSEEYELAFIDADSSVFPTTIIDSIIRKDILPLWT